MATLLGHLSASYARQLNAAEVLRFLFDLDIRLYLLQGDMSLVFGNGTHTKHRHTRYHDFFTGYLIQMSLFERDWMVPLKRELGVEWRLDTTHETEYTIESFAAEINATELGLMHIEIRWGEVWSELWLVQ